MPGRHFGDGLAGPPVRPLDEIREDAENGYAHPEETLMLLDRLEGLLLPAELEPAVSSPSSGEQFEAGIQQAAAYQSSLRRNKPAERRGRKPKERP